MNQTRKQEDGVRIWCGRFTRVTNEPKKWLQQYKDKQKLEKESIWAAICITSANLGTILKTKLVPISYSPFILICTIILYLKSLAHLLTN